MDNRVEPRNMATLTANRGLQMTTAVCVRCGSLKYGAFNHCKACGVRPETEIDLAYSLALTDRYFSVDVLHQISADMCTGRPRPLLPKDQENEMRQAVRMYLERFGQTFDLPPPENPLVRRRSAKFAGWIRDIGRPRTVSRLRWRAGFGWIAVTLLVITGAMAALTGGIVRVFAVAAALLILLFTIYQWRKWTKRGWPQIHHRAMLAYAQIAGQEAVRAEQENQKFSKTGACRSLALAMVHGKWQQASIDVMISALEVEGGAYFADVIEKYGVEANPRLDAEAIHAIGDKVRRLELGPQLVIGNIVHNTFGGKEAARYVIALATGKAQ
jgi:hypothetical protein